MNLPDVSGCRVHDIFSLMLDVFWISGHLIHLVTSEDGFRHGGQIAFHPVFAGFDLATGPFLSVSGDVGHAERLAAVDLVDYFI